MAGFPVRSGGAAGQCFEQVRDSRCVISHRIVELYSAHRGALFRAYSIFTTPCVRPVPDRPLSVRTLQPEPLVHQLPCLILSTHTVHDCHARKGFASDVSVIESSPTKATPALNQYDALVPAKRSPFVLATSVKRRDESALPRADPIWQDVWNREPPTDCSSLYPSALRTMVLRYREAQRGSNATYCSTRLDMRMLPIVVARSMFHATRHCAGNSMAQKRVPSGRTAYSTPAMLFGQLD